MNILGFLGGPFGYVMSFIYNIVHDYGWALILFILLTRILQFPLGIKQQKSTARMAAFQPKLNQIKKQFAKDKQRMNQETMKLYEEEGINPTSGCLPMLITFVLLFGIIDVIYNPLIHILHVDQSLISEAINVLGSSAGGAPQLTIISQIQNGGQYAQELTGIFGSDIVAQIQSFNMNFLGLNLGAIPQENFLSPVIIIPILSFGTQILSTLLMMKTQKQNGMEMMGGMKWTMLLMPLLSLWFAITLPAGVGLYWTVSNVLMIAQTLILQKMYPPEKVIAMSQKDIEKTREKMRLKRAKMDELSARMNEKKGITPNTQPKKAEKLDAAEERARVNKRIAEARRRMAEKYGDEYKED